MVIIEKFGMTKPSIMKMMKRAMGRDDNQGPQPQLFPAVSLLDDVFAVTVHNVSLTFLIFRQLAARFKLISILSYFC